MLPRALRRVAYVGESCPGLIAEVLECREGSLGEARRLLLEKAKAPFVLNLDADTVVPAEYPLKAVRILQHDLQVGAVALNYRPKPQFHLAFGTSVWPAKLMRELYDWRNSGLDPPCECIYMWRRLTAAGRVLATLPLSAEHKRDMLSQHNQLERPEQ